MEKIIFDALHAMCDGKTNQEEIAKGLGISRPYLNRLLNKKRPIDGITLRALRKLFPNATLHLHCDTVSADNSGTNNGVVGVNNGTVTQSMDAVIDKILSTDDLTAEEKIKVLKVLKK